MSAQPPSSLPTDTVTVTLLTQPDCALCEQAKDILARVSGEHPLAVTELDLTTPAGRELAVRHGVLFAPGVLINDEPFSYGRLSEKKLRRQLSKRAAPISSLPPVVDQ